METQTIAVGDIVETTDDSGYPKLMLVMIAGNHTGWEKDGGMKTIHAYTGPLFDSWFQVNTPTGTMNFPAIQVSPAEWVMRKPEDVFNKLAWEDNPMSPEWGN